MPIKGCPESIGANAVFEAIRAAVGTEYSTRYSLGLAIKPDEYVSADAFALDYGVSKFLSKFERGGDKSEKRAKAVTAFKDAEEKNRLTNKRFRSLSFSGPALFCLEEARKEVSRVLGRFKWDEFESCCNWGPGATATIMAKDATVDQKILESHLSVSRLALPYAKFVLSHDPNWLSARWKCDVSGPVSLLTDEFLIRDSGRFTTVPKDWKTDRGIDVQPTFNLFLQKGLGSMIRRRLKRVGVDLDDQSRNQMLAGLAQRVGLATIDLAQASDSLCFELVKYLLPDTWFAILRDLRTPSVSIDGDEVTLEKFSAMGNGYTFELESLVFWSLIKAIRSRFGCFDLPFGVYGDDLIIDSRLGGALIALLAEVGFRTNVDKTFLEGRFYESCGKHYFDGIDVTPPYQKEVVGCLSSAIRCANRIYRWAKRLGGGVNPDPRLHGPWEAAVKTCAYFLDEVNSLRWASAVERNQHVDRLAPFPMPFIPDWLEDDFGLLWPDRFRSRNGVIYFDRLLARPVSRPAIQEDALVANYLRLGISSEQATYGFVNPRGSMRPVWCVGKTTIVPHAGWPESWPKNLQSQDWS
jgi:hypothetical protein